MKHLPAIFIGFTAGIAGGLLGIGGAIIMVPCMVYFLKLSHHTATATSLAVVLPTTIISALVYQSFGQLDLFLAGLFAAGGVIGAYLGSRLMPKLKPQVLRRIFAATALLLAIKMGMTP